MGFLGYEFLLIVLLFYFALLRESLRLCVKWLFVVYCESGRQILLLVDTID